MLQVATWVRVTVAAILIAGILIAMPNALSSDVRAHLPPFLQKTLSLGLDLQGGSYLLLEVDLNQVQKDKLENLMGDIRVTLRRAHIGFSDVTAKGDQVSVRIIDSSRFEDAKQALLGVNPSSSGGVLAVGARDFDMSYPGNDVVTMKMTQAYLSQTKEQILGQ